MRRIPGNINNLQILRAFAAINVVIFHIIGTSIDYGFEIDKLSLFRGWGANGVDVFFVLSGFVMLHSQLQKKRSAWNLLVCNNDYSFFFFFSTSFKRQFNDAFN